MGHRQPSPRPQPCSGRNRKASLLVNKRNRAGSQRRTGPGRGPEGGASRGRTLAIAKGRQPMAPAPRGTLQPSLAVPSSLDLLHSDARQALALSTVWVGYGLYLDLP